MKPGLYVATVRGEEGVRIIVDRNGREFVVSTRDVEGFITHGLDKVTDARPLVVLDPESGDDRHRFRVVFYEVTGNNVTPRQAAAILNALAAPTPAEPMGLGAVVQCRDGRLATRCNTKPDHPWVFQGQAGSYSWEYLTCDGAAEVLSEGWTP